jgi:hypothetical protein
MSAAQAFATEERSKIGILYVQKDVKANETFFREFYGKEVIESMY